MKLLVRLLATVGITAMLASGAVAVDTALAPVSSVAEASVGGTCTFPGVCGRIHQRMGSGTSLTITKTWDCGSTCTLRTLTNGQNSEPTWSDAEGFLVSPGVVVHLWRWDNLYGWRYWGDFSGQWVRVDDIQGGGFWQVNWATFGP